MDFDTTIQDDYKVDSDPQEFIRKFNTEKHVHLFGWSDPRTLETKTLNSIVRHIKKTIRSMPCFDRRKN